MWPKLAVNYTNKTQFLIRINKGILDISDDNGLNDKMLENDFNIRKFLALVVIFISLIIFFIIFEFNFIFFR